MNNNSHTLNFRRYAKPGAPVLVLVHGFLGSSAYWLPTVVGLRRFFDIIAVDLPGFGGSAHVTPPDSIQGVAAMIERDLDALGVERYSLVGCSLGGMISQQFAIDHPGRLDGLVLYGTAAQGDLPDRFESWDASIARLQGQDVEMLADKAIATWFIDGANHPYFPTCREAGRGASKDACITLMRNMQKWSAVEQLGTIRARTLVLVGDRDNSTKPAESFRIWRAIPAASLVVIPGCSHGVHMEDPATFNRVVGDFLLEPRKEAAT